MEKTLKKPSKPLIFSKTVATSYLVPEAPSTRRTKARRGGQAGRPPIPDERWDITTGTDNMLARRELNALDRYSLAGLHRVLLARNRRPLCKEQVSLLSVWQRFRQPLMSSGRGVLVGFEHNIRPRRLQGYRGARRKMRLNSTDL